MRGLSHGFSCGCLALCYWCHKCLCLAWRHSLASLLRGVGAPRQDVTRRCALERFTALGSGQRYETSLGGGPCGLGKDNCFHLLAKTNSFPHFCMFRSEGPEGIGCCFRVRRVVRVCWVVLWCCGALVGLGSDLDRGENRCWLFNDEVLGSGFCPRLLSGLRVLRWPVVGVCVCVCVCHA